ncbi:DUF4198 domain-containing protein [Croceicoccus sp. F390]|uniref:DUF4198 domain-containing protein n=1 Tax=Croceicoccus esteveae TaxID=3075597 RepID=A0ABU2ZEU6_9SPHN|nr:DUF4198 domain-containing protein [Croceicoccus sp. F390]MDT0574731.1 DUF4198 domain-containing protein [Croceicoccus sp. F390]
MPFTHHLFVRSCLVAAIAGAGLATLMPQSAEAHRRWLLPSATVLAGEDGMVSVDAAASNGLFVFEHRPLPLDTLVITGPAGDTVEPTVIGTGAYRSVFDVPLKQQGTYRIALASDGWAGTYQHAGEQHRWRGTQADIATSIPADATNVVLGETSSRTETFVTLGLPDARALALTGSGIEMIPVTHPNDLVAGEPAQMRMIVDGQPAPGLKVEFVQGGTRYRDNAGVEELTTDADGMLTLTAPQPGLFYMETAHEGVSQSGSPRRMSYTAVLEFLPL